MNKARVVIALGNSALRQRGSNTDYSAKLLQDFCSTIVKLSHKYEIVIVPSMPANLPAAPSRSSQPHPLTYDLAMQQGQIGYHLIQNLDNELAKSRRAQKSLSLITRVVVDRQDLAFRHPSYVLPQTYDQKTALHFAKTARWVVQEFSDGYHRLVPAPMPQQIIEAKSISALLDSGALIVALGCGGIPVVRTKVLRTLKGIEAVVDSDLAAEKLAELIRADIFISLIDEPNVYLNYSTAQALPLNFLSKKELCNYIQTNQFSPCILTKLQAANQFASRHRFTAITSIEQLELAINRRSGTIIS